MKVARVGLVIALPWLAAAECNKSSTANRYGTLELSWIVRLDGEPAVCHQLGGSDVVVIATWDETMESFEASFPCDSGDGQIDDLPEGPYHVAIKLMSGTSVLRELPPIGTSIEKEATTDLGTFTFDFVVDSEVSVRFHVDHGEPGGPNCVAAPGGPNPNEQRIYLYESGNFVCIDLPLAIDADTFDTCGAPAPCIERTVDQRIQLPAAGDYVLRAEVYGQSGNLCFQSESLAFTANAGETELTILAPLVEGCLTDQSTGSPSK